MTGHLDITPLLMKLRKLPANAEVELDQVIRQEGARFVSNTGNVPGMVQVTAPFSQRDRGSQAALFSAKKSIDRDLASVFSPVSIKGERTIPHLFGDHNPDVGRKPPYIVKTVETWPDVAAIAEERKRRKFATNRRTMSRGQRAALYVDRSKLEIVRRESYAMIGLACACWYLAALEATLVLRGVPAFVARHTNAPSAGSITFPPHGIRIVLSSSLPYNAALGVHGKMTRVLGYRHSALERRLPFLVADAIKKAQLKAA